MNKWPKLLASLTPEQKWISDDFMKYWHEALAQKYKIVDRFNHHYVVKNTLNPFSSTLEIGAGLGEHIDYEQLTQTQRCQYVALELRENMADQIRIRHPDIQVWVGDCQNTINATDNYFERVLAIHVLEHLPNLPAAIKEIYRVCNKNDGFFSIVIPCEGGLAYSLARKISAKRIFEKRYKQPYKWFIEREHINKPLEIMEELAPYFDVIHREFYPLKIPTVSLNLCIGLTLKPKRQQATFS